MFTCSFILSCEMNVTSPLCKVWLVILETLNLDMLFLQIAYGLSVILILFSNIWLIKLLWKHRQITVNLSFIILSSFDIMTGAITLPLILLRIIKKDITCIIRALIQFFSVVSCMCPMSIMALIAVDRYMIITRQSVHGKYITKKFICYYIANSTFIILGAAVWYVVAAKTLGTNTVYFVLSSIFVLAIMVIFGLYIHLVYFVFKKSKVMKGRRHEKKNINNYSVRTAKTIFILLLSLTICNVGYFASIFFLWKANIKDPVIVRNLLLWSQLISYLNSFFNSVILIYRSRNLREQRTVPACYRTDKIKISKI